MRSATELQRGCLGSFVPHIPHTNIKLMWQQRTLAPWHCMHLSLGCRHWRCSLSTAVGAQWYIDKEARYWAAH